MSRTLRWHIKHAFHNIVTHPLLPLAEILNDTNCRLSADVLFWLHDATNPMNDDRNRHVYF